MSVVVSDSEVRLSRPLAKRQRWLFLDPPPAPPPPPVPAATVTAPVGATPVAEAPQPPVPPPLLSEVTPNVVSVRPVLVSIAAPPVVPPPLPQMHARPNPLPRVLALLRMRITAPAWLVSLVVHLITLIVLGIWMMPVRETPQQTLVVAIAQPQSAELETLPDVIFTPPPEVYEAVAIDSPTTSLTELQTTADTAAASAGGVNALDAPIFEAASPADILGSGDVAMRSIGDGSAYSAEFFGVKAKGRRFVFIVDASGSMSGIRFNHAKEELMYAVRRLDKSQLFYVIFFNSNTYRMFEADGDKPPAERPVPATTANIKELAQWLKRVDAQTQTNPRQAVEYALDLRPDAIYILSDGEFTDGGTTLQYLAQANILDDPVDGKRPRVTIHTIGFHGKEGELTLQTIAKTYGGVYRFVAGPVARGRP